MKLSSGPSTSVQPLVSVAGWQNPETSALLSQSEISPRGAPQFPVVLKRVASSEFLSATVFLAVALLNASIIGLYNLPCIEAGH